MWNNFIKNCIILYVTVDKLVTQIGWTNNDFFEDWYLGNLRKHSARFTAVIYALVYFFKKFILW